MTTEQKLAAALDHCLGLATGPGPLVPKVMPYMHVLQADSTWTDAERHELSRRLICALRDRMETEADEVML